MAGCQVGVLTRFSEPEGRAVAGPVALPAIAARTVAVADVCVGDWAVVFAVISPLGDVLAICGGAVQTEVSSGWITEARAVVPDCSASVAGSGI